MREIDFSSIINLSKCKLLTVTCTSFYFIFMNTKTFELFYVDIEQNKIAKAFKCGIKTNDNYQWRCVLNIIKTDDFIVTTENGNRYMIYHDDEYWNIIVKIGIMLDNLKINSQFIFGLFGPVFKVIDVKKSKEEKSQVKIFKKNGTKSFYLNDSSKFVILIDFKTNIMIYDMQKIRIVATVFTGIVEIEEMTVYSDKYINIISSNNEHDIYTLMINLNENDNNKESLKQIRWIFCIFIHFLSSFFI